MNSYKIPGEIRKFLTNNIDLIDASNFEALYDKADELALARRDITDALLAADINPLEYLDYVPSGYLRGSRRSNKGIVIPNNIIEIEAYAFSGTDIETIVIPEGVTTILNGALGNCPYLHKVYFPSTLKKIGDKVFTGSASNESVGTLNIIYNGTREQWSQIKKGVRWTSLNPQFDVIIECSNDYFSYSVATGEVDLI